MNTAMGFQGALAACALLFAGCSSAPDSPGGQGDALRLSSVRVVAGECGGSGGIACSTACHDGGSIADAGSADGESADAGSADSGPADGSSADGEPPAEYRACQADEDCVAVALAGCCNNGWKTAVNRDEVDAYDAAFACQRERPICPLYIVDDTRVAECDHAARLCGMVAIEDIACEGFVAHPHACPDGYACVLPHIPDLPGRCVPDGD